MKQSGEIEYSCDLMLHAKLSLIASECWRACCVCSSVSCRLVIGALRGMTMFVPEDEAYVGRTVNPIAAKRTGSDDATLYT